MVHIIILHVGWCADRSGSANACACVCVCSVHYFASTRFSNCLLWINNAQLNAHVRSILKTIIYNIYIHNSYNRKHALAQTRHKHLLYAELVGRCIIFHGCVLPTSNRVPSPNINSCSWLVCLVLHSNNSLVELRARDDTSICQNH